MSFEVRCFLDDFELDKEPLGLQQVALSIVRDNELHGIGYESSTTPLEFIGNALEYLEDIETTQGLKGNVMFRAEMKCAPGDEFETIISGVVNLAQAKGKCGVVCSISAITQSNSCETVLKNRYDQQADLDAIVAFDQTTALNDYDGIGLTMELPTKELDYVTEGYVLATDEPATVADNAFSIRPLYGQVIAANFNISELDNASFISFAAGGGGLSPVVLWDERLINFPSPVTVNGRMKGSISWDAFLKQPFIENGEVHLIFAVGEYTGGTVVGTILEDHLLHTFPSGPNAAGSLTFDYTFAPYSWSPVDDGTNGIYMYISVGTSDCSAITVTFDPETYAKLETTKEVPPTEAQVYLIHEALSKIVETVTDGCMRVKSSYYGRVDSEPFAFPSDGCGGKRFLTSGLKIRNATNPKFFLSPQDAINGLQAIDNIGVGTEPDPDKPGSYLLRIEDLDYFYVENEIFRCDFIKQSSWQIETNRYVSTIEIGYKKWETQANFGLDEYNANRTYRTSLTSVQNKLEKTSNLVAGEYALELTREQQFADSNDADTTYDNDTFIVCLARNGAYGYMYGYGGNLEVEQGNIDLPENIFSPGTSYNYRITPARNLMRWFRTIMASYPNITDSDNRLYFTKGEGNLLAKGILSDAATNPCTFELVPISESQDITATVFKDQVNATPLWKNKTYTFDYPLSIADYQALKAMPYGYVSFQCGHGAWLKGWIVNLKFQPFQGMANFTLRLKYN